MRNFQDIFPIYEGEVEDLQQSIKDQTASIYKMEDEGKPKEDIKAEKDHLADLKKDLVQAKKSEREEDTGLKSVEDVDLAITDIKSEMQKVSDTDEKKKLQKRLDKLEAKKNTIKKSEHEKKAKESDVLGKAGEALKSGDIYDRALGALFAGGLELFKKTYHKMKAENPKESEKALKQVVDDHKESNKKGIPFHQSEKAQAAAKRSPEVKKYLDKKEKERQEQSKTPGKEKTPEEYKNKHNVEKVLKQIGKNKIGNVSVKTAYNNKKHEAHPKAVAMVKKAMGESFDDIFGDYISEEYASIYEADLMKELEKEFKKSNSLDKDIKEKTPDLEKELEDQMKKSEDLAKKVGGGKEVEPVDDKTGEKASDDFDTDSIIDNKDKMDKVPSEETNAGAEGAVDELGAEGMEDAGPKVKEGDEVEIYDPEDPKGKKKIKVTVQSDPITGEILDPRTGLPMQKDAEGNPVAVDPKTGRAVADTAPIDPMTGEKKPENPEDADPKQLPFADKVRMIVSLFKEYGFSNFDFKLDDGKNTLIVDGEVEKKIIDHAKSICDGLKILLDVKVKTIDKKKKITEISFVNNMGRKDFDKIWSTIVRRENEKKANAIGMGVGV